MHAPHVWICTHARLYVHYFVQKLLILHPPMLTYIWTSIYIRSHTATWQQLPIIPVFTLANILARTHSHCNYIQSTYAYPNNFRAFAYTFVWFFFPLQPTGVKAGILQRYATDLKKWQPRWCVIDDNFGAMAYYEQGEPAAGPAAPPAR